MMIFSVTGNLGADAEVREINQRKAITFRMCSTSKRGDKDESTWVSVLYRDAPNLLPYLKKGVRVFVSGEGRVSTYTKDGQTHVDVSVFAHSIDLCGGKHEQVEQPQIQKNDRLFPDNNDNEFPF
jgi:single-stranded DNA-binding protein